MEHCFERCDPANPAAPAPNHLRKRGFIADVSVTVTILPMGTGDGESVYPQADGLPASSWTLEVPTRRWMPMERCLSFVSRRSLKLENGRSLVPWHWIKFYICYVRITYTRRKYSRSIWTCWRNLTKLGRYSLKTPVRRLNGQVPGVWGSAF